jgi:hypothetical protein
MDQFRLTQNRYSVKNNDGTLEYRIDITCNIVSDSSDPVILTPDVFVYNVDNTLQADVSSGGSIDGSFIRVATVADLDSLLTSRESALSSNATEYRARVLQLSMPDLETATNAIPVIVDRINALVDTYISYQRNFYSVTATEYLLPQSTDSSVVSTYTNAYRNSISARQAAEVERDSLQSEYQSLQVKNEIANSYVQELSSYINSLSPHISKLKELNSEVNADPSVGVSTKQGLGEVTFLLGSMLNLVSAIRDNRGIAYSSTYAQEANSLSQLNNKQDEVASLEAAEAQALNDLATYCPQVDPTLVS